MEPAEAGSRYIDGLIPPSGSVPPLPVVPPPAGGGREERPPGEREEGPGLGQGRYPGRRGEGWGLGSLAPAWRRKGYMGRVGWSVGG